jgi:acetyl esterase
VQSLVDLRRAAGAALVDNFFRGIALSSALLPMSRPSTHGVHRVRNIRYRASASTAHLLDVYLPPDHFRGPRPVCIYYHGGGFRILSKDTHWLMALAFARRGFVVFNVDYRNASEAPFPGAHEDASWAYRWVLDHASAFDGDLDRLVVAGESAGANLAAGLMLGTCWERPEPWARDLWDTGVTPRAVVPFCGIFQVTDPQRHVRRRGGRLPVWLRDRLQEIPEEYLRGVDRRQISFDFVDPVVALERATPPDRPVPPVFLSVGTADPLLDDTRRMDLAPRRLGVDVTTRYYPGEVHAFQAFIWRRNARRCWGDTFRFLERALDTPLLTDS